MSSGNKLKVESRSIQRFYDEYLNNEYQVNRRYQRKLVWTLQQKQNLIDSIIKGLPLPLLLLARIETPGNVPGFEIVDGLQRLDAIVSYINNEFSWNGKFFNLEAMASTKERQDDEEDPLTQRGIEDDGVLGRDLSRLIANYELPFSIFETDSYSEVDEVFGRINSSGRLLSPHEVRQAGVLNRLAELVRSLSATVRSDDSLKNVYPLQDAPRFSLDFDGSGRGIDGQTIFWYRNGILRSDNLRSSSDEQLIADIVLDLLGTNLTLNNDTRDESYDPDSKLGRAIQTKLSEPGKVTSSTKIEKRFMNVMGVLSELEAELAPETSNSKPSRSSALMKHLGLDLNNPSGRYFHTLFLAIDGNLLKENRLKSATSLLEDLEDYFLNEKVQSGSNWKWNARNESVNKLRKLISESFEPGDPDSIINSQNRIDFVTSRLEKLPHEGELFELKAGLTDLRSPSRKQIGKKMSDLVKTATAMRNTHPSDEGVILVGIAENENAMKALEEFRGTKAVPVSGSNSFHGVYITGIEHDLDALDLDLDEYVDIAKQALSPKSSPADTEFLSQLLESFDILPLKDRSGEFRHLIFMQVPKSEKVVTYDGEAFLREGSSTVKANYVQSERMQAVYKSLPSQ